MRHNVALTAASLLSILFVTFHMADDIVRGMEKGGPSTLIVVPILAVWLYGTVVLAGRRTGYTIMLLGSLLGVVVPFVHFKGAGGVVAGEIAKSATRRCSGLASLAAELHIAITNQILAPAKCHPCGGRPSPASLR